MDRFLTSRASKTTSRGTTGCSVIAGLYLASTAVLGYDLESRVPLEPADPATTLEVSRLPVTTDAYWTFTLDNDLLSPSNEDRDYTGGFNVIVSGDVPGAFAALNRRLDNWLERRSSMTEWPESPSVWDQDAIQFGLLVFTPDDIGAEQALPDERPYANLLFLSSASHALNRNQTVLRQSRLTVGVLGSSVAETVQSAIHKRSTSEEPRGYDHQISDGGELTAQYAIAYHTLLSTRARGLVQSDVKLFVEGAVGYLTETSIGLDLRWGRITTPWWSSVSGYADYTTRPSPGYPYRSRGANDLYLFAGMKLHARAYSALLQGQFRDSDVTLESSDLYHLITEVWLGLTANFNRLRLSYALRYQSAEIRRGLGSRDMTWAGITVAHSF